MSFFSIAVLLVLLVLGLILYRFKYPKLAKISFMLAGIFFILIGCGILPTILLSNLQLHPYYENKPTWQQHNAIIVLGAGTFKNAQTDQVQNGIFGFSRILKAADLYFDCKKHTQNCNVILSGGDAAKLGTTEAVLFERALLQIGVIKQDLILEEKSSNTYENAKWVDQILQKQPYETVVLTTSGFHLTRALLCFSNFKVQPIPIAADYINPPKTWFPIAYNFALNDIAMHEYEGMLQFYIYNAMDWNQPRILINSENKDVKKERQAILLTYLSTIIGWRKSF